MKLLVQVFACVLLVGWVSSANAQTNVLEEDIYAKDPALEDEDDIEILNQIDQLTKELPVTEAPEVIKARENDPKVCITKNNLQGVCGDPNTCKGKVPKTNARTGKFFTPYRALKTCPAGKECCVPSEETTPVITTTTTKSPVTPRNNITKFYGLEPILEGCGVRKQDGTGYRSITRRTKFAEFSWTVAIFRFRNNRWRYLCSGSLIHPRVVLSVAHYFDRFEDHEDAFRIRAGDWNLNKNSEPRPHQETEVVSVEIHEDFDDGAKAYDVGLLFLQTAIRPKENIGFACLPEASVATPVGTKCIASGWGMSRLGGTFQDYMKMVDVPIVDHGICQARLREGLENPLYELSESTLCAGGEEGKDPCKGDGGAPLVCAYEDGSSRYYQAGIVSWGIDCGVKDMPGAYVDVAYIRSWIDYTLSANGIGTETYTPPGTSEPDLIHK